MNIAKDIISKEGKIYPLLVPVENTKGSSLTNPSILNYDGKILVNLRNLNYILYHAETNKNEHVWGPLVYLHPENDQTLTTYNILCELDDDFNISSHQIVDTSKLDVKPLWEFVGLEDVRLVKWEDKLYMCGVRRDTTPNGVGRMELSQIELQDGNIVEIDRQRMPAPSPDSSYCEKNWMPILDRPYHFVKWSNPTEVVKYDPVNKTTETVIAKDFINYGTYDLRGGSQVIPYGDKYIAVLHEVDLYKSEANRKDADYYHRFVMWDNDFNLIKVSERLRFMDAKIEFCCGLCQKDDEFLIVFGYQDNGSFLLRMKQETLLEYLK